MSLFLLPPSSRRRTGQDGFALVIALSLMAFVLLLILSLTTLIRVESQSAEMAWSAFLRIGTVAHQMRVELISWRPLRIL